MSWVSWTILVCCVGIIALAWYDCWKFTQKERRTRDDEQER